METAVVRFLSTCRPTVPSPMTSATGLRSVVISERALTHLPSRVLVTDRVGRATLSMASSVSTVAKSGWLQRQSNLLKRWKSSWFVLGTDGNVRYFDSETASRAEDIILVPREVLAVFSGNQVEGSVQPPQNGCRDSLLVLKLRQSRTMVLCANSQDDAKAWQLALEQARVLPVFQVAQTTCPPANATAVPFYPPPTYPRHYVIPSVSSPWESSYIVQGPNGASTIVMRQNYNRYSPGDLAVGMVAGAALGTMMWTPLLWWC